MTFSFLQSLTENVNSLHADLKNSDTTDAGKSDVSNKAHSVKDIDFSMMRNVINSDGEITGSDIANYIERAEELNDEIDTIAFGLETDDGHVVKVYVNAEQSEAFEKALTNMLGVEEDIEETLNALAGEFDIVDVIWPTGDQRAAKPDDETESLPGDNPNEVGNQIDGIVPDTIFGGTDDEDEEYETIAALPDTSPGPSSSEENPETLPDVPDTEEGGVWSKLNDIAINKFGKDENSEILGVRDLNDEQLGEIIDLDLANEIAQTQYEAADFMSLDEDEQKEIIEANPNLIKGEDMPETETDKSTPDNPDGNEEDVSIDPDEDTDVESDPGVLPESKFSFLSSLI